MSPKEFDSVLRAVGGIDKLIDWEGKDPQITLMKYMEDKTAKEDKVYDDPLLMRTHDRPEHPDHHRGRGSAGHYRRNRPL